MFTIFDDPIEAAESKKTLGQTYSQGMKAKQKRKSVSCTNKRKKPTFKVISDYDDPLTEEDIFNSFKRALFAKGMKYVTSLVYDREDCPESMNDPSLESVV